MSVILVITCFAGFFDFSTADSLKTCSSDSDCYQWLDDYCIYKRCYSKKSYGFSCTYDRQCDEGNLRCFSGKCRCYDDNKWLRTRCVSDNFCDYDSDCSTDYYCSGNRCYNDRTSWSTGKIVSVTISTLIVIIVVIGIIAAIEIRRRRVRQMPHTICGHCFP